MLPETKPWSCLTCSLYFIALAQRTRSSVETRVSPTAQTEAAWLGFISFTAVCLAVWWDI